MDDLSLANSWLRDAKELRRAVISGRRSGLQPEYLRIDIRPVLIKKTLHLQTVGHDGRKDITKNILPENIDLGKFIADGYANIRIESAKEIYEIQVLEDKKIRIRKSRNDSPVVDLTLDHDRKKVRRLPISDPIFQSLGIADKDGELIPRQSDKYKQVDEFLKLIEDLLPDLAEENLVSLVDLGCGNAYLSFAAYRFLELKGIPAKVTGVDNRKDSVIRNSKVAEQLGLTSKIIFIESDINKLNPEKHSIVIALHACDTATDDAIAFGIRSKAKAILVSPCCHHDLNKQMNSASGNMQLVLRHGIVKERFADLLTDSIRAQVLKIFGYKSEIIEFISLEHTARNLMIRAVQSKTSDSGTELKNLHSLLEQWQVSPYLLNELSNEIAALPGR
ncbi:MAG: class I SAM-dependent methyltransferase [Actinomycetales bacterium]